SLTFENFAYLASPRSTEAIRNTVILAVTTPIAIILFASFLSYVVANRRGALLSRSLDGLATLPIGLPGVVLGVALLWSYFRLTWVPIYGTIGLLLVGYATKYLPYGYRNLSAGQAQQHEEL